MQLNAVVELNLAKIVFQAPGGAAVGSSVMRGHLRRGQVLTRRTPARCWRFGGAITTSATRTRSSDG